MITRGTTLGTGPLVDIIISTDENRYNNNNHVWFDARLKPGTTVEVDWGDGTTSLLSPLDKCLSSVDHYYKKHETARTYRIEFYSEDRNALLELYCWLCNVDIDWAYFIHCYSLEKLQIQRACSLTFGIWACWSLEELYIDYCRGITLNTTFGFSAPRLKTLQCNYSTLEEIDLRGFKEVETLICRSCHRLKKIILSNNSKLRCVDFDGTDLYKNSMSFISKLIEKNSTTNE